MNLLILFKLLKPTLKLDLLNKEVVISEILHMYGITKYFIVLMCVSSIFFWYCYLFVFKDSLLLNRFLSFPVNGQLMVLKISVVR